MSFVSSLRSSDSFESTTSSVSVSSSTEYEGELVLADSKQVRGVVKWNIPEVTGYSWPPVGEVAFKEKVYADLMNKGCTEKEIARLVRLCAAHHLLVMDPKLKYIGEFFLSTSNLEPLKSRDVCLIKEAAEIKPLMEKLSLKILEILKATFNHFNFEDSSCDLEYLRAQRFDLRAQGFDRVLKSAKKKFVQDGEVEEVVQDLKVELTRVNEDLAAKTPFLYDVEKVEALKKAKFEGIVEAALESINRGDSVHSVMAYIAKAYGDVVIDLFEGEIAKVGELRKSLYEKTYNKEYGAKLYGRVKGMDSSLRTGMFHHLSETKQTPFITITHKGEEISLTSYYWMNEYLNRYETQEMFGYYITDSVVIFRNKYSDDIKECIGYAFDEFTVNLEDNHQLLFEKLGKLYWILTHAKPFEEGNDMIVKLFITALAKSKGVIIEGYNNDLCVEALVSFKAEEFSAKFVDLITLKE